ncbi:MAG TPA: cysteine methyltransferase, partial [Bacteroidia bacterium]|nr:cysteine methyltransferase [Bacteroidia bacterium]
MIYTYFDNPLGEMLALSDGEVLTGLYFGVEKHLPELDSNWKQQNKNALFQLTQKQLSEYAKG